MQIKLVGLAVIGALSLASSSVYAEGVKDLKVGVSTEIGSTGFSLHATTPITDKFSARMGLSGLNYSNSLNTSDARYDADLKLRMLDALVDFYPMNSGFRLTGGLILNGNKFDASAKPTGAGSYTFNGNAYSTASVGRVDAKVDFNTVAPYLGLGWGSSVQQKQGWTFVADLGVMFQGSPDVSIKSSGCTVSAAICNQLTSDLKGEESKLKREADSFKFYPVVRAGIGYNF